MATGDLTLVDQPQTSTGSDPAGVFDAIGLSWAQAGTSTVQFITTFKAYHGRSAIVFQQEWPTGVTNAKGGSTFPSLRQVTENELGTLEYTGLVFYRVLHLSDGSFDYVEHA